MPHNIDGETGLYENVATEEELLAFANKVREAGGANILDALLPSQPGKAEACLIARACNFDCEVDAWKGEWTMRPSLPEDQAVALAKKLDLKYEVERDGGWVTTLIYLPEEIGNAAAAFDAGVAFQRYVEVVR